MNKSSLVTLWDRIGIAISALCAIHCLFFPVVVALLPLWPAAYAIHDWTHPILFLLIVPTVVFALRKHDGTFWIPFLLYSGLFAVGSAWVLHDTLGATGEAGLTFLGSLLLISGHWYNYRKHLAAKHKNKSNEEIKFYA